VGIGGRCGIGAVGGWSGVLVGAGGDDGGDGKGQQQDLRFVHVWLRPERRGEDGPDGCRDRTTLNLPGPPGGCRRSCRDAEWTGSPPVPDDTASLVTDDFCPFWRPAAVPTISLAAIGGNQTGTTCLPSAIFPRPTPTACARSTVSASTCRAACSACSAPTAPASRR